MRSAAILTLIALGMALFDPAARARDLMLDSDTELGPTGLQVSGWTFTLLTLASMGYAAVSYGQSQDELDKADSDYKKYQAAGTTADALFYRARVEKHHDEAKSAETRANVAIALTVLFAMTAFFSFSPDSAPNMSLTATLDGPMLEWRF